ncbi:MAG: phosphatidate cytidylyltransferase [Boseongicola sp.]|nr:phosphatidate cytidylyltransferase [Boseongicola sp.]MDD9979725.1 phosphatidate cytidylyltransferase [Boseongicola sp.]
MTPSGGKWDDLTTRLVSGGLAASIGLISMWIGGDVFHVLIAVICGIIVWELTRMIGGDRLAIPFGVLAGLVLLAFVTFPAAYLLPILFLPALIGVSQLEEHKVSFALFSSITLLAGFGLVLLRDDFGFAWMAWLALVVIASDILGYFAGRFIGGPKFWPKVSPKKTWSGTLAGWLGAALVALCYIWSGMAGYELIGISIAVAIAGQLGDVAESALKRNVGVKDSSNILPGHGGMFDRFDAMIGASIFLLLVEQLVDFPPLPAGV